MTKIHSNYRPDNYLVIHTLNLPSVSFVKETVKIMTYVLAACFPFPMAAPKYLCNSYKVNKQIRKWIQQNYQTNLKLISSYNTIKT